MMSRPPCWRSETITSRSKLILWELNSFLMQILSFVSINKYDSWSHVRTHSIASPLRDLKDY